jgi:hypothetical protein
MNFLSIFTIFKNIDQQTEANTPYSSYGGFILVPLYETLTVYSPLFLCNPLRDQAFGFLPGSDTLADFGRNWRVDFLHRSFGILAFFSHP